MRYRFEVTMHIPDDLDRESVQAYVADSVATMMGCFPPEDPILHTNKVVVRALGLKPIEREVSYTFYYPGFSSYF